MEQNVLYVAKKSILPAFSIWRILFFWLIIPLIMIIVDIIKLKCYTIEFYDDRAIQRYGVIAKNEDVSVFSGVYSVSVSQTVMGRIFNYGDVNVDAVGKWDISSTGIKNPNGLKKYLNSRIVSKGQINNIVVG